MASGGRSSSGYLVCVSWGGEWGDLEELPLGRLVVGEGGE